MEIFSKTDTGMVRSSNQDAALHGTFADGNVWAIVCDGMGGANGGNVASSTAVQEIAERIAANYESGMTGNELRELLGRAINAANIKVYIQAQEDLSVCARRSAAAHHRSFRGAGDGGPRRAD